MPEVIKVNRSEDETDELVTRLLDKWGKEGAMYLMCGKDGRCGPIQDFGPKDNFSETGTEYYLIGDPGAWRALEASIKKGYEYKL